MPNRQMYKRANDAAELVDRLRELERRLAAVESDIRRCLGALGLPS